MGIWPLNYPETMEYRVHIGVELPVVSANVDVIIQSDIHPRPFLGYHRTTYESLS